MGACDRVSGGRAQRAPTMVTLSMLNSVYCIPALLDFGEGFGVEAVARAGVAGAVARGGDAEAGDDIAAAARWSCQGFDVGEFVNH